MKKLLLLILIAVNFASYSQQVLYANYSSGIYADGHLDETDWQTANSTTIETGPHTITIKAMHDSAALLFAFMGPLESASSLFPELLFDVNNARSASWQNDDWWFHVSMTDCEHKGAYGVYDSCKSNPHDWEGAPNYVFGPPVTDTVEIKIPLQKLGLANLPESLGLSLLVTNTFDIFAHWPGSANRESPATWGILKFNRYTGVNDADKNDAISVYPNPSAGIVHIEMKDPGAGRIRLLDPQGREVSTEMETSHNGITLKTPSKGLYFLHVTTGSASVIKRILVQ